jgi:ribosomal protein L4
MMFPLVAMPAIVLISVTLTFATNRYRAIAEGALVVLAAVAIDAAVRWWQARRRQSTSADPGGGEDRSDERVLTGT